MRRDMKDVLKNHRNSRGSDRDSGDRVLSRAKLKRSPHGDLPRKLPMYRARGYSSRGWGVLNSFLRSRLGQQWDDVYGEICAVTDQRCYRGYWLFDQLRWLVKSVRPEWYWYGFWVDENGVLQYDLGRKYTRKPKPVTKLLTNDPDVWFEWINGFWFWMYREDRIIHSVWREEWLEMEDGEVVIKERVHENWNERATITKRQVGKRTLKKIRKALATILVGETCKTDSKISW